MLILYVLITVVRLSMPPTKIASTQGMPVPISAGTSTRVTNSAASATMPTASGGTPCHGCVAMADTATLMMTAVSISRRLIGPSRCISVRTTSLVMPAVRRRPHDEQIDRDHQRHTR